jgi:hypothetical protein
MAYKPISIQFVPQYRGDEGLVLHFVPTAAETFLKGDVLKIASGKVLVQVTANAGPHLGVAVQDALTVATPGTAAVLRTYVPVQIIRVNDLWVGLLGSSETYADTDSLGTSYDLIKVASGNWRPSKASAAASLKLVASAEVSSAVTNAGPAANYTAGGPVYFKFLSASTTTQWNV